MDERGAKQAGPRLFFEDFEPGTIFDLGEKAVSEKQILAFARKYDPQPFHTDKDAAA